MFNRILGTLSGRTATSIFVLTGGIEWDISVPSRAAGLFGPSGEQVEVFTWLHHYEDGMRLFGFPSEHERAVFLDLMKVEGIGPKQAIKILSGISPADLSVALETSNLAALQKVSGVGPKMAQKMVLALKGRLVELDAEGNPPAPSSPWSDVVAALADMGFDRKATETAVRKLAADLPTGVDGERELFRRALLDLSAGGSK
ncbi:MAG: Holliday junction branch migration protein RuvA [Spirochaetae bacterium HGW-Spirochaetae-9]|nr:MAG: Holliday junction branch migration protein RuvA [Spirochaetae bacterium HGW-Spirochaetae-9]